MNRPQNAEQSIDHAEKLLQFADVGASHNFLEVGCGNGSVSKYIAQKYHFTVTGVDIDPDQIRRALKNTEAIPNIHFLAADATRLPFWDDQFDLTLSFGVMHHISNWLDALREIKRVLKPKGYFIFYDMIFPDWAVKIGKMFKNSYGVTTMDDVSSFFAKNGKQ
ncbi:2-methoxy-6-polyprenyl-1,4-benzoquinol methylase [subsurface metagenome]